RDGGDHAADEGVDDVQCRDLDQHAARGSGADAFGQVVLERQRKLVVHVHLDGDQQDVAHLQDRDALHQAAFATVTPVRLSASARASARLALVTMPCRSRPRWTMVCAICGRTPLMMASAPIRRIAVTVLSRCWATRVSTVGTPVMSMIAISEPVSTIRCSS